MAAESAFADLRKLSDWLASSPTRSSQLIERLVQRLGSTAIPLLGRELRSMDRRRREASRTALADLAADDAIRSRVIAELRSITGSEIGGDEIKVCALVCSRSSASVGPRGSPIRPRSSIAPRSHSRARSDSEADVASAADLMVRQLDEDDMVQMLE